MKNPYEVLGISPSATNQEVRDAYRALAKKYHPDNYEGSPISDIAEEKMKEINAAYDEILRIRAGEKTEESSYSSDSSFESSSKDPIYAKIRRLINNGDYNAAGSLLNQIDQMKRGGEWFFLKGCVLLHAGYYFDAIRHVDRACELEPDNKEYQTLRQNLRTQSEAYGNPASRNAGGCNLCDVCAAMYCLNCLCR